MNAIESSSHDSPRERPPIDEEAERLRRVQLEQLRKRFRVAKSNYYLRDEQGTLAFTDTGAKVTTRLDDPKIARSMVELAAAKGWPSISVTGSPAFRREVWLAASLRGLPVRGYSPQEVDQVRLQELVQEGQGPSRTTTVQLERSATPLPPGDAGVSEPAGELSRAQTVVVDAITTIMRERGDSEQAIERARALAIERLVTDRVHVGRIVEARAERFEHDPKGRMSYLVKLETPSGEREVWGVDLQRALREGRVAVGSQVAISHEGRTLVDVLVPDPDRPGALQTLRTYQNIWRATDLDRLTQVARQRVWKLAEHAPRTDPVLRVYDVNAAPATLRPTPTISRQRDQERSRG